MQNCLQISTTYLFFNERLIIFYEKNYLNLTSSNHRKFSLFKIFIIMSRKLKHQIISLNDRHLEMLVTWGSLLSCKCILTSTPACHHLKGQEGIGGWDGGLRWESGICWMDFHRRKGGSLAGRTCLCFWIGG